MPRLIKACHHRLLVLRYQYGSHVRSGLTNLFNRDDHSILGLLASWIDTCKVLSEVVEDVSGMSAYLLGSVQSHIPKETPDVGCCEIDPIASTVFVDFDLLGDSSICEDDHLVPSAFCTDAEDVGTHLVWRNHLRRNLS